MTAAKKDNTLAAVDLEEAVLGAIMLEKDAIHQVIDILKNPKIFSVFSNEIIYENILEMFEKDDPIDILTVTNKLKSKGRLQQIGGAYYITQLTNRVGSSANIQFHARILAQKYIQRKFGEHALQLLTDSQKEETDAIDLIDYNQEFNNEVSSYMHAGDSKKIQDISKDFFEELERQMNSDNHLAGYSTSFYELDEITLGMQDGSLIVIAGRPMEGKTVLGCNMAVHIADYKKIPVAIFSLEMPSKQLMARMLSADTQILHDKIKRGSLSEYDVERLRKSKIHNLPIYIYDNSNLTINELRAHAIRLHYEKDVKLIIVDYLQLMHGTRKTHTAVDG